MLEVTARSAANLLDIHPNTAALFYKNIRQIISFHLALQASEFLMVVLNLMRDILAVVSKGKRGRGAAGKVAVFGILKRGGKVYTVVVEDTKSSTLITVLTREIAPDSIVYTDTYKCYNALMSVVFAIRGLIIQHTLPRVRIISMVLKIFGIRQKSAEEI